jgi:hypothetical protein
MDLLGPLHPQQTKLFTTTHFRCGDEPQSRDACRLLRTALPKIDQVPIRVPSPIRAWGDLSLNFYPAISRVPGWRKASPATLDNELAEVISELTSMVGLDAVRP